MLSNSKLHPTLPITVSTSELLNFTAMSETSTISPVSPIPYRDVRSASKPFKRDKERTQKWRYGQRPLPGVSIRFTSSYGLDQSQEDHLVSPGLMTIGGSNDAHREKVRPASTNIHEPKRPCGNQAPKPHVQPHDYSGHSIGRIFGKVNALEGTREQTDAAKSLFDVLPDHANTMNAAIRTANLSPDDGILDSFDKQGKSPGVKGREMGLGGLVEQAEKNFLAEQTDRIVKGEYEIIDVEGEIIVLGGGRKGKRAFPKQRAKSESSVIIGKLEDDDGFELV
jgi:hypothetical protein